MKSLIIAPHPDDEILGAGGTLLKRKAEGSSIAWVIVTSMFEENGFESKEIKKREKEIEEISKLIGFDKVFKLGFPSTKLSSENLGKLISELSNCLKIFEPSEIFLPHPSDSHSDHRIVFEAAASCSKWFRSPFIKRILSYETISETNISLYKDKNFNPNFYVDISKYLDMKNKAMKVYESEINKFPFPRSEEAINALAKFRGSSSGHFASEAFELLLERD